MKKILIIIIASLYPLLSAQNSVRPPQTRINIYEIFKKDRENRIIKAIILAESGGRWDAYNAKEEALGVLQLRPVMVRHVSTLSDKEYKLSDRLDSLKSVEMFKLLMSIRNPRYDIDTACNLWNAGNPNPTNQRIKDKVSIYKQRVLNYLI
jgi:hypothetical protein